jgi:hypothetical protein
LNVNCALEVPFLGADRREGRWLATRWVGVGYILAVSIMINAAGTGALTLQQLNSRSEAVQVGEPGVDGLTT